MTPEGFFMSYSTFFIITAFVAFVVFAPMQLWLLASDWILLAFLAAFVLSVLWHSKTQGAGSYHWRLWRFHLSVCHLRAKHWRWRPWKRVSLHYWNPKK